MAFSVWPECGLPRLLGERAKNGLFLSWEHVATSHHTLYDLLWQLPRPMPMGGFVPSRPDAATASHNAMR